MRTQELVEEIDASADVVVHRIPNTTSFEDNPFRKAWRGTKWSLARPQGRHLWDHYAKQGLVYIEQDGQPLGLGIPGQELFHPDDRPYSRQELEDLEWEAPELPDFRPGRSTE